MSAQVILKGFLSNDEKRIGVWCPECVCFHIHSWVPGNVDYSHRISHCLPDSKYKSGYMIVPFTTRETKGF